MMVSHINDAFKVAHILNDFELQSVEVTANFDLFSLYSSVSTEDNLDYLNLLLISDTSLEERSILVHQRYKTLPHIQS